MAALFSVTTFITTQVFLLTAVSVLFILSEFKLTGIDISLFASV